MPLRTKVGILAIALLLGALFLRLGPWDQREVAAWISGCQRVGFVLVFLWLALPELERLSPWYAVTIMGVLIVLVRFPRFFIGAVIVAVLVLLLRPRTAARGQRPRA
jgi:hypothetical protein